MQAIALSKTVPPVTAEELKDWLSLDGDDPNLETCLLLATNAAIRHMNHDIEQRQWRAVWNPPSELRNGITVTRNLLPDTFELPYSGLIEVESVEIGGEAVEGFEVDTLSRPGRVALESTATKQTVIVYTAGFAEIPEEVRMAVKMIAAYIYDHRGCDAMGAVKNSGAAEVLQPWVVHMVL